MEAELNAKSSDEKRPVEKYDQAKETISEVAALSFSISVIASIHYMTP